MNEQLIQKVQALVQGIKAKDEKSMQMAAQIKQAADQGDQQAKQIWEVIQQMMTQKAANGAKLNYLKELNGICPEGYEMKKYAVGGRVVSKCMKCGGKPMQKASGGPVDQYKEARAKAKREGKKVMQPQPAPMDRAKAAQKRDGKAVTPSQPSPMPNKAKQDKPLKKSK